MNMACYTKRDKNIQPSIIYINVDRTKKVFEYIDEYVKRFMIKHPVVLCFENKELSNFDNVKKIYEYALSKGIKILAVSGDIKEFSDELLKYNIYYVSLYEYEQEIISDIVPSPHLEQEQEKEIVVIDNPVYVDRVVEKIVEKFIPSVDLFHKGNIRGGQEIISENGSSIFIQGNLNENGIINSSKNVTIYGSASGKIISKGHVVILGSGNGKVVVSGSDNLSIYVLKFNLSLVSINGFSKMFEDGVPDNLKNKSVCIFVENNSLKFEEISIV